jgi:hypothetical protein
MGRARLAVVIGIATFAALAAGVAPARAAEGSDVVSVKPAEGSRLDPNRSYFVLDEGPGAVVTQSVVVTNFNKHAVDVEVDPVDGMTAGGTGAAYGRPDSAPSRTGTWISVSTPAFSLEPGASRSVPFTVRVPDDVGPGQYLAGISTIVPLEDKAGTTTATGNGAQFDITLQAQRVIAVQVNVPGPAAPKLVISGATPSANSDGITLKIGITNEGNAFARGTGLITVADTGLRKEFEIDTFVSKTSISYSVPWTTELVPGSHEVKVRLAYDGGRIASWTGAVDITGTTKRDLEAQLENTRIVDDGSGARSPLVWIGLVAILGCIVGAIALRKRTQRPAGLGPAVN